MQFHEGNQQTAVPPQLSPTMYPAHPSPNPLKASQRKQNLQKASKQPEIISIPTDQEEKHQLTRSMFDSHFKYEISKAQLTGSTFDKLFAIMKYLETGSTLKEKEEKAKTYIRQFFFNKMQINVEVDHFVPRVEAGLLQSSGLIYEKRYLVYGIDLLTIRQVINNYSFKNPTKKFLDSSHLLLEFATNQQGWKFLEYRVISFNKSLLVPMEQNANVLARNWVELSSYGQLIFDRRQFIRNFTQADEKYFAGRPPLPEHYRLYQQTKKQLIDTIREAPQIKTIFQVIANAEENEKKQSKGYRSFIRDKKRFIRGNDRFGKSNSSFSGSIHSGQSSNDRPNGYGYPRYNPQNMQQRAPDFKRPPERGGMDRAVYTGNPRTSEYAPPQDFPNYKNRTQQTRKQHDPRMRKGPFFKQNGQFINQNAYREQTQPTYPANNYQNNHPQQQHPNRQMNHGPNNAGYQQQRYNSNQGNYHNPNRQNTPFTNPQRNQHSQENSSTPPVPQIQTIRKSMMQDLQSQRSNSHYSSLQVQLQDFQLFSGQLSSVNEHSKHQISHIHQPQFSFHNDSSSCHLNSDFTPSNLHTSSQHNASSGLEMEMDNPDFRQHFSSAIEQIAPVSIKEEPEEDKDFQDLLMNVSSKKEQIESEESSEWNLNLQQEPSQPALAKETKITANKKQKQGQKTGVVDLEQ